MNSPGSIARLTPHQERILKTLETTDGEISTQDLYVRMRASHKTLGLATVYRGLEVLRLQGLVQSRNSIEGEALYSLVQKHQHYFTCLQCSKSMTIADADGKPFDACPACKIEAELEQKQSLKVFYHTLEFFGLCTFCQAAGN
jgi:Fur family transcriptional regulator, ferric uptake regulator